MTVLFTLTGCTNRLHLQTVLIKCTFYQNIFIKCTFYQNIFIKCTFINHLLTFLATGQSGVSIISILCQLILSFVLLTNTKSSVKVKVKSRRLGLHQNCNVQPPPLFGPNNKLSFGPKNKAGWTDFWMVRPLLKICRKNFDCY